MRKQKYNRQAKIAKEKHSSTNKQLLHNLPSHPVGSNHASHPLPQGVTIKPTSPLGSNHKTNFTTGEVTMQPTLSSSREYPCNPPSPPVGSNPETNFPSGK